MEFIKFEIDELTADSVFCQYREVTEEGKGELKTRTFPLDKISQEIPEIPRLVAGTITCLLYTSPSPRDLSTSRMPSSA